MHCAWCGVKYNFQQILNTSHYQCQEMEAHTRQIQGSEFTRKFRFSTLQI